MQSNEISAGPTVKLRLFATKNDKKAQTMPNKIEVRIICLADLEKERAIAAGKTSKAVVKNIPITCRVTAIVTAKRIKKESSQYLFLTPEILARSEFRLISIIFLMPKIV